MRNRFLDGPDPEELMIASFEAYREAWNMHDPEKIKLISVRNLKRSINGVREVANQDEYAAAMERNFIAFPDLKFEVTCRFTKDCKIYHQWASYGTNTGTFMGNPPSGKVFETHGLTITLYNEDGKLTREDSYYSPLSVFLQLGYTMPKPKHIELKKIYAFV